MEELREDLSPIEAIDFADRLWDELSIYIAIFKAPKVNEENFDKYADSLLMLANNTKKVTDFAINTNNENLMQMIVDNLQMGDALFLAIAKRYDCNLVDDTKPGQMLRDINAILGNIRLLRRYHPEMKPRHPLPGWISPDNGKTGISANCSTPEKPILPDDAPKNTILPDDKTINTPIELQNYRKELQKAMDNGLLSFENNKAKWSGSDVSLGFLLGILICGDYLLIGDNGDAMWKFGNKKKRISKHLWQWFSVENSRARSHNAIKGVKSLPEEANIIKQICYDHLARKKE